ncbi:bifunctional 5,10-methylenetetrahydrofolate dehydrogenase/5,10-methenyltetrahydrofolate cyclohydrolase [Nafulsella turpanensis]|uniref:bifunctional 5,10-methylenetetrahydrofolate dehydrogenase/5,10-methenyltetrahydrofolate cyclohydrolase n=1 Tax=Nafulsella turpanensis TaxID=1265690 RepID=UPI00034CF850|nr:tetrahydrofolate dehydrogenase/cyclohydrolase catalytic domain-containing protein [Nafulsella turpanensis]
MSATLLQGKELSLQIQSEIADKVKALTAAGGKVPHLAAVLIGNNGASETYVDHKVKACEKVGFKSTLVRHDDTISEGDLLRVVDELNENDDIDGFIVQLPLPKHIDVNKVIEAIKPSKDVDGFHPINFGRMAGNMPAYIPATPDGIIEMLKRYKIETTGKHTVVVGRSQIVGTPVSILLSRAAYPGDSTVTLCHRHTKDLASFTKSADILVVATGIPGMISGDMVKEGVVVIDVGITRVEDKSRKSGYSLKGDVDFDSVAPKASYITPVPGGVGPMTIASLLKNTFLAAEKAIYKG